MSWNFNKLMDSMRRLTASIAGFESYANWFPDWEVCQACQSFDTTGNVAPGNLLVLSAGSNGGPVYVSGDAESTEHLLGRLVAMKAAGRKTAAEVLSVSYAIHLHCL